jgi:hypothetical protein
VRSEAQFDEILHGLERHQHSVEAAAVIPDMLVTDYDRELNIFRNMNGYIEDPLYEEYSRRRVNTWTAEEKGIFIEKLADFSVRNDKEGLRKNFYRISHYLPNKNTRECIEYYYLAKKDKPFRWSPRPEILIVNIFTLLLRFTGPCGGAV